MNDDTNLAAPQSAPASDTTAPAPVAPEAVQAAPAADNVAQDSSAVPAVVQKRVRIVIPSGEGPDGKNDVFASDGQGQQVLIKRDVEVSVPVGVLEVLKLAKTEVHSVDSNFSLSGSRDIPRFNIQVLE